MARVIQLRRGTTAAHNIFTGMPGEITYNTETKTVHVHDGQTLGGMPLARADADMAENGAAFDITTVPDAFWADIVARHAPVTGGIRVYDGMQCPIDNVAYIEYIWNNNAPIHWAQAFLACQTPEADYAVGDVVAAFGIGTRSNPAPITYAGATGMHVRLGVGGDTFWVVHKTTGVVTNITNERWKIMFRIWY